MLVGNVGTLDATIWDMSVKRTEKPAETRSEDAEKTVGRESFREVLIRAMANTKNEK